MGVALACAIPPPLSSHITNSNNFRTVHVFCKNKLYFQDGEVCSSDSCMPFRESQLEYSVQICFDCIFHEHFWVFNLLETLKLRREKFSYLKQSCKILLHITKAILKKSVLLYPRSLIIFIQIIFYHKISPQKLVQVEVRAYYAVELCLSSTPRGI